MQYRSEYPVPTPVSKASIAAAVNSPRTADPESPSLEAPSPHSPTDPQHSIQRRPVAKPAPPPSRKPRGSGKAAPTSSDSAGEGGATATAKRAPKKKAKKPVRAASSGSSGDAVFDAEPEGSLESDNWEDRLAYVKKHLPKGIDAAAAKQIFNEIVVQGDEVHWSDIAGLDAAKKALKEAVVYPFLRPDLFMGLREPARGMLLFGPPGTGKTMLARAVATESRSTFFAISASSLTSKWLGDSEKLVRALFGLARALAPSIIFVDEIDSLLSSRGGSSEHESTRRIKTEFLIQWSDLQRAAAGKEATKSAEGGDPTRVLVLAATNMPWAIDDAARRRFVRRQYIPLPERAVRAEQIRTLLGHQKHELDVEDIEVLVRLTDGTSASFPFQLSLQFSFPLPLLLSLFQLFQQTLR
jgi:fidgetin-like protein 1